jgi:phenylpropionate dioxygenase-like ring-hydroxylating dioxygenase large terminal subunit
VSPRVVDSNLISKLSEYWYIAACSSELRTRPVARTVLGTPLVLFRRLDGTVAALIDRCAHRNMALSRGRVREGSIECPYHGWRYGADGRCVEIPSLERSVEPPANAAVRSFQTTERDGFVWVYMGSKNPAQPPYSFPHSGEPRWTTFRMKTRFAANAFACLENFLDCPHTVYVHTTWFRSRDAREVRAQVVPCKDGVEVEFFDEREAKSVVSRLLFPAGKKMIHKDRFLMPTTSRVDYSFGPDRHFIITSQCTPITERETEVYTVITFRFGQLGALVKIFFAPLARRIIRQDVRILKAQAEQLERFGESRFTFVKSDLVGPHIWELWKRAGSDGNAAMATPVCAEKKEVILRF